MTPVTDSFRDILSQAEADFALTILSELGNRLGQPIVAGINDNGGLTRENKERFFEVRSTYALQRARIALEKSDDSEP